VDDLLDIPWEDMFRSGDDSADIDRKGMGTETMAKKKSVSGASTPVMMPLP
jgi:hypothetical protein